jgi:hypothetical protein
MQLRPRTISLEKKCFYDLSEVPNTGSSGKIHKEKIKKTFSMT